MQIQGGHRIPPVVRPKDLKQFVPAQVCLSLRRAELEVSHEPVRDRVPQIVRALALHAADGGNQRQVIAVVPDGPKTELVERGGKEIVQCLRMAHRRERGAIPGVRRRLRQPGYHPGNSPNPPFIDPHARVQGRLGGRILGQERRRTDLADHLRRQGNAAARGHDRMLLLE